MNASTHIPFEYDAIVRTYGEWLATHDEYLDNRAYFTSPEFLADVKRLSRSPSVLAPVASFNVDHGDDGGPALLIAIRSEVDPTKLDGLVAYFDTYVDVVVSSGRIVLTTQTPLT